MTGIEELIEALTIFSKYVSPDCKFPTHCEHDVLTVCYLDPSIVVLEEDARRLNELGFFYSDEHEGWSSFKFGSC